MRKPVGPQTPSKPELSPHMTSIEVEHTVIVALRPEAARRDVPVTRLVHDLLDAIATNHLTTVVLGD
jgi:hypothetical protein